MADSFLNKSGLTRLWGKITAALTNKADKSDTLNGYGITNAYTKAEVDTKLNAKANSASTLGGYGITDAYTKTDVNTELNKKENASNKVTSWQSTPDNTHYPSEKLVKDGLDGKANSSHTHSKSQITDFPSSMPASDVYSWAKASSKPSYGISEISGLQSALNGKEVTSNKVTSWSSTTTDAHYPSEKLVKAGLDGKANSSHTHSISQITNLQSTLDGKANKSHSHDGLIEQKTVSFSGNLTTNASVVFNTLPAINKIGSLIFVTINGGSMVNKLSSPQFASFSIGLKMPGSGTYQIIANKGALSFKGSGNKEYTMSLSDLLNNVDYETAENNNFSSTIYKNDTLSITGTISFLMIRMG